MAPSPSTRFPTTSLFALLSLFPSSASARLPFNSTVSVPILKHSNEVSFDPLGVAAVLSNPRAETSAARLYAQPDRAIFRWPHMMMIGGALTPVSVLVDYLTSQFSSINPAVSMSLKDRITLPVRSTMVFPELPVSLSNAWLCDVLAFKPSRWPENDFAIAHVEDAFVQPTLYRGGIRKRSHRHTVLAPVTLLDLLSLICGLLLLTALVFSVLTGDLWAVVLFLVYTAHWLASTLVSFYPPITVQSNDKIVTDASKQYCVYQRPEGGTVVLVGRKDTLERWARTTWIFDDADSRRGSRKWALHWVWVGTGALAAITSVACMVNMAAYLQLAFLGVLGYSSLAEILATQVARKLQARSLKRVDEGKKGSSGAREPVIVKENRTRTKGIIRATLLCGLEGEMWFKLKLLPHIVEFEKMLPVLDALQAVDDEAGMRKAVAGYRSQFGAAGDGEKDGTRKLAERIATEMEEAWIETRSLLHA
ncbi:hypothetical protein LshimejAT787_0113040 [Lyophyllum shimeji]|uniref:Uncharacterized protein n=1 Tax=Lyophyllum shimeji TaxID=47721 RepID=A0A9P3UKF2_LYOSH|nr:hypothetical protein LshimejAT787_0113040 [Lyophyllum shimeji]